MKNNYAHKGLHYKKYGNEGLQSKKYAHKGLHYNCIMNTPIKEDKGYNVCEVVIMYEE